MRIVLTLCMLAAALALSACSEAPASIPKPSAQERHDAAEAALSKAPVVRRYGVGEHELLVFEAPARAWRGRVEYQTCFVWRDREFRTAALQCPGDASASEGLSVGSEPEGPHP